MSDPSKYDAAIVEAAEAFIDEAPISRAFAAASVVRILDAVQAKREAQRPRCDIDQCLNRAVQSTNLRRFGTSIIYRCAEHKVTVTNL